MGLEKFFAVASRLFCLCSRLCSWFLYAGLGSVCRWFSVVFFVGLRGF